MDRSPREGRCMPESEKGLKTLIQESGLGANPDISARLQAYLVLLVKWNSRINLTSSTKWDVLGPLFQEGIWASKFYPKNAANHLDIGSGAGFPAILLKILNPDIRLDLVESRAKKAVFLETAASALELNGVRVHAMRLQTFLRESDRSKTWNCVSWKAVKLSSNDIRMLLAHAEAGTQFWMHHGREPAVEEPLIMEQSFRLFREERFSGRKLWGLSIYLPK